MNIGLTVRRIFLLAVCAFFGCRQEPFPKNPPTTDTATSRRIGVCDPPREYRNIFAYTAGPGAKYCGCVNPRTVGGDHPDNLAAEKCAARSLAERRSFYIVYLDRSLYARAGTSSGKVMFFELLEYGSLKQTLCHEPDVRYGRIVCKNPRIGV
jgi:hypothetical protein